MVLKAEGKLVFRKQLMKRKDGILKIDVKVFLYIPTDVWRDSQWPFKTETQDVCIRINRSSSMLTVTRIEEKASNKPGRGE